MVRTPLLCIGVALICAPLIIYSLDSLIGLGRLDPLTLSTLTGGIGAGLAALSHGDRWLHFFSTLVAGLLLVALQVYGIAFLVLATDWT